MVSHLSGIVRGVPPLPSSPLGILSSFPLKPIIPDSAAQQEKEREGRERVSDFPSSERTNLLLSHVIQPGIEIGKCDCPNKFI